MESCETCQVSGKQDQFDLEKVQVFGMLKWDCITWGKGRSEWWTGRQEWLWKITRTEKVKTVSKTYSQPKSKGKYRRQGTSKGFYLKLCRMRSFIERLSAIQPRVRLVCFLFLTVTHYKQVSINNVLLIVQLTVQCIQWQTQRSFVCSSKMSSLFHQ